MKWIDHQRKVKIRIKEIEDLINNGIIKGYRLDMLKETYQTNLQVLQVINDKVQLESAISLNTTRH